MSTLAIVEPNPSGHHLFYVRLLALEGLRRGSRVVIALSPTARSSPQFATHLADLGNRVAWDTSVAGPLSWTVLQQLAERLCPDSMIVPDGDSLVMRIRGVPWWTGPTLRLLIMRDHGHKGRFLGVAPLSTVMKRVLIARANRASDLIRVIPLKSATYRPRAGETVALDPVVYQADAESIARARELLDAKAGPGAQWVGVLGAITARKNVPLIGEAIESTARSTLGLLVAGNIAEDQRAAIALTADRLRGAGHPVLVVDRELANSEFDAFVGAVDCIALAHLNEGPSGLFGKALAAGTPIVAAGAKSLRGDAKRFPEHARWARLNSSAVADAFGAAIGMSCAPRQLRTDEQFVTTLLEWE